MQPKEEQQQASFCPYCGRQLESPRESELPYCPDCKRHILPLPEITASAEERLKGIRGWLVLPAIGAVLSPISQLVGIVQSYDILNDPFVEHVFERNPGLQGLVMFELATNCVLLGLSIWLAVSFFGKRRYAPTLYISYILINILISVVLLAGSAAVLDGELTAQQGAQTAVLVVAACIWIPYFRVSKRVKATFVN